MALRTLLLRLLLLAAFFNAAVGMPMHELGHLKELAASQVTEERVTGVGATDDEPSGHVEAHGLCAWCAAYAVQGMVPTFVTAMTVPAEALAPHAVRKGADFVPAGWRWRFAARDPPFAPT